MQKFTRTSLNKITIPKPNVPVRVKNMVVPNFDPLHVGSLKIGDGKANQFEPAYNTGLNFPKSQGRQPEVQNDTPQVRLEIESNLKYLQVETLVKPIPEIKPDQTQLPKLMTTKLPSFYGQEVRSGFITDLGTVIPPQTNTKDCK